MKAINLLLFVAVILFNSCDKNANLNDLSNSYQQYAINMTPDSLKGREFVFDSLEWIDNDFGRPFCDLVDSNLFMPARHLSVMIKHDTSSVWEQVNLYYGGQGSWGYLYNMSVGVLSVWPNPAEGLLIGKRFSLKVKFL